MIVSTYTFIFVSYEYLHEIIFKNCLNEHVCDKFLQIAL